MRNVSRSHRCAQAFIVAALMLTASAIPRALVAQGTGTLRGVVTHAEAPYSIAGACISVGRPGCAATTDVRGSYTVRGLAAGQVSVTVTAIGAKPSRHEVTISAGQATTLNVAMDQGPLMLSSIISTATRVPTEATKVATTINVLTPEQVATSPSRESQDMLREIPGVELPRTSSLVGGTAQIVSIRGVDEGRTAVLFDGVPVNDAWGEWIDWGRVPKGMIDHVEVVEGGTSNLYGNGAIGGVISFFSRPLRPGSVMATLDGGSRSGKHGFLAAGLPIAGALTAYVSGDYLADGGYTLLDPAKVGPVDQPSNITQRNGYFRLNYAPAGNWSAFASAHLFGDTRKLGTPLTLASRHQHDFTFGVNRGELATGMFSGRVWEGYQTEFQRATTIRGNSTTCPVATSTARACEDSSAIATIPSHDEGASVTWTKAKLFGFESFTIGGDYRHMGGEYDETDFSTSCPGANCGKVSRTITSGGDQLLGGVFAQAILAPAAPLRVELGVRFDTWNNNNGHSNDPTTGDSSYADRSKSAVSPRVGARYDFGHGFTMHGAFYRAFRAPNLAELYRKQISATSITIPNPNLDAEDGQGWEGGIDWQPASWIQFKGTAYIAHYHHFNVPVQISAGPPAVRTRLNINHSTSKGGEMYLTLRPLRELFVSVSANYDHDVDDSTGAKVNRVPDPRYTVRASYASRMLGTYTVIYKYEGQTTTLQGLPLAPFGVVDAQAQRELTPSVTAWFAIENIGNEQYQVNISGTGAAALISYGMPRTLRLGMNFSR